MWDCTDQLVVLEKGLGQRIEIGLERDKMIFDADPNKLETVKE
jgi:hypothetical protein